MKIRHILASTLLAGFAALGLAAGLKAAPVREARAAEAEHYTFQIGVEFQKVGEGEKDYWDKDNAKFAIHIYNNEDAGKMGDDWSEMFEATEGVHQYIVSFTTSNYFDPFEGANTKIEINRYSPEATKVDDATWNHAGPISFGQLVYVNGWSSASAVRHRLHIKSHGWNLEYASALTKVKNENGVLKAYADIELSDADEFKYVVNDTYTGRFACHSSLSEIMTGDYSNNISCSTAGVYSFYGNEIEIESIKHAQIYITYPKFAAADEYAQGFLDATSVCDATGVSNNITSVIWNGQKTAWTALGSVSGAQELFAGVTGDEKGNYMEKAVARYEYIIEKYGSVAYEDFMNRYGGAIIPPKTNSFDNSIAMQGNSYFVIAVIVVTIAAISAGSVLILRRRKEN